LERRHHDLYAIVPDSLEFADMKSESSLAVGPLIPAVY
jgi:hypothetical protein